MPIFKKNLFHQKWRPFWIFEIFATIAKHKNAYILKTVLDRADYADFGCHNSIRLEAEHFLNTSALTFISFSRRFVFAVQKHYLFFASDPLVFFPIIIDSYFPINKFYFIIFSLLIHAVILPLIHFYPMFVHCKS